MPASFGEANRTDILLTSLLNNCFIKEFSPLGQ